MKEYKGRRPEAFSYHPRHNQRLTLHEGLRSIEDHGLHEGRCDCWNLLFKFKPGEYIEIKCRRCKRLHIIPFSRLREFYENEDDL